MDLQAPIIFAGLFIVASAALFLIYKFGIKEKSYEEALAEQRQQTQALLGPKPKPKDKKTKKAAKKAKEKQSTESETTDEPEPEPHQDHPHKKLHVEFKEQAEEVPLQDSVPPTARKRIKKDKVRPILVSKEHADDALPTNIMLDDLGTTINHFEERHPKDELELLMSAEGAKPDAAKSHKSKEQEQSPPAKPAKSKSPQPHIADVTTKSSKPKQPQTESNDSPKPTKSLTKPPSPPEGPTKSKQSQSSTDSTTNSTEALKSKSKSSPPSPPTDSVKSESKTAKPKGEVEIKATKSQKLDAAKTVEKKNEVATVPEREDRKPEPTSNGLISTGGKEKKKKKNELMQHLSANPEGASLQVLLNLVRNAELSRSEVQILIDMLLNKQHEVPAVLDEWSEGKADQIQRLKRQLAEKEKQLENEREAATGAQAKLREIRSEQQTEKAQLQLKIKSVDELLQNKQVEMTRMHQQMQQLQAQLKEELMKGHKLRDELAAMQMQSQQIEMRLAQAQNTEVVINQLQNEIQEVSTLNNQLKMELARLSEENVGEKDRQQAYLAKMANFQKEVEQKNELIRKLEESHHELESNMERAIRKENDFNVEISHLNSTYQQQAEELRRLEHGKKQFQDEMYRLQKEKDDYDKLILRYKSELDQLQNENTQLQQQAATQVKSSVTNEMREVEVLNLQNQLATLEQDWHENQKKHSDELIAIKGTVDKLQNELKEQQEKNNALRTRNWKVMEALNAAESRIKSGKGNVEFDKMRVEQTEREIQFIQRLFPEIKELQTLSQDEFGTHCEKYVRSYIENLKKCDDNSSALQEKDEKIASLETANKQYQNTIDSAEILLKNLQSHVEKEELKWRTTLAQTTTELENLTQNLVPQLRAKVVELEKQLEGESADKNRVANELQELKSRTNSSNSMATIEKLSQEVNCLREQLQMEQNKNGDVDPSSKTKNCNSTNGPGLIQYCISSSSSIASSLSEVSVKKAKSKKKKKKGSTN